MSSTIRAVVAAALVAVSLTGCESAGAADPSGGPTSAIGSKSPTAWLYELWDDGSAAGETGTLRTVRVDGKDYPESTSFWVGCDGEPAVTAFNLGGTYTRLHGAWALDIETPAGISVGLKLTADGKALDERSMSTGDGVAPFDLDVSGVEKLELTAERTAGECAPAPYGYGLMLDAAIQ